MMMGENASVEEQSINKFKLSDREDRLSDLPDSIIHHILSFLPSIKDAIQTCVLSKSWKNQWTGVPVLIFDLEEMSDDDASRFVFNTLTSFDCSKINKLQIKKVGDYSKEYPDLIESIKFSVKKHVEELILDLDQCDFYLPECIFDHPSLVSLYVSGCEIDPKGKVCWGNLKELFIEYCVLSDEAVHNILSGSPVLESLVFDSCGQCDHLIIDSESLKKLELGFDLSSVLEISCPNLEQLNFVGSFSSRTVKIKNSPSLKHVTLDSDEEFDENSSKKLLQQLQHVKSLKFGIRFIKFMSNLEVRAALSLQLLNNKCLTLYSPDFDTHSAGIACALHSSHLLEKLVITKGYCEETDFPSSAENHWSSNNIVFTCLESHLKVVEILGFSKKCPDYKHMVNFIEFILKNAKVLEKLVLIGDFDFESEVSLETFGFGCSPHATVKFLRFV